MYENEFMKKKKKKERKQCTSPQRSGMDGLLVLAMIRFHSLVADPKRIMK